MDETVKVVEINKGKSKRKYGLEFPSELSDYLSLRKCRKIQWIKEEDGYLMVPIRTRTNRERVNNIRLPEGAFKTIKVKDTKLL